MPALATTGAFAVNDGFARGEGDVVCCCCALAFDPCEGRTAGDGGTAFVVPGEGGGQYWVGVVDAGEEEGFGLYGWEETYWEEEGMH